jgi:hypothetical protein
LILDLPDSVNVEFPDVESLLVRQIRVVDLVVNTRFEGLVENTRSVSRQEQNAVVIVQDAQKDCSRTAMVNITTFHIEKCDSYLTPGHFCW